MARTASVVIGWVLAASLCFPAAHARDASESAPVASPTAAADGDAQARYEAGVALMNGASGTRDPALALLQFRAAADRGHAQAQTRLGVLYEDGDGVAADPAQAVYWYRKAAEQGEVAGQRNLGLAYLTGMGVAQDDGTGARWIRLSAGQDFAAAQATLAMLHELGRGVPADALLARDWYRRAAQGGHARAAARLEDYACLEADTCTRRHGMGLTYATRATLRLALKQDGAILTREDAGYVSDLYLGGDATPARDIRAGYFQDRLFELVYGYRDQAMFVRELAALDARLGKHEVGEDEASGSGGHDRRWRAPDGVVIHARRCGSCTSAEIRYELPAVKSAYEASQAAKATPETPVAVEPEGVTGPERVERSDRRIAQLVLRGRPAVLLGERELRKSSCDFGIPISPTSMRHVDPPDWSHHIATRADGRYDVTIGLRDGEDDPVLVFVGVQPGRPQRVNVPALVVGGGPPESVEFELDFPAEPPCVRILQVNQLGADIARRLMTAVDLDVTGLELLTDPTPLTFNFDAISASEVLVLIGDMAGLEVEQVREREFVLRAAQAQAERKE